MMSVWKEKEDFHRRCQVSSPNPERVLRQAQGTGSECDKRGDEAPGPSEGSLRAHSSARAPAEGFHSRNKVLTGAPLLRGKHFMY